MYICTMYVQYTLYTYDYTYITVYVRYIRICETSSNHWLWEVIGGIGIRLYLTRVAL